MTSSSHDAVSVAFLRSRHWHVLFVLLAAWTACGGKSEQRAASNPANPADTGGAFSTGGASMGGGIWSGGGDSSGVASTGGGDTGGVASTGGASAIHIVLTGGANAGGSISSGGTGLAQTQIVDGGRVDSGQASPCSMTDVQRAVTDAAIHGNPGWCYVSSDPADSDTLGQPWGTILIDGSGYISSVTGPAIGIEYTLRTQGWVCPSAVGSTILYWCSITL